jgi:hypothetical protein
LPFGVPSTVVGSQPGVGRHTCGLRTRLGHWSPIPSEDRLAFMRRSRGTFRPRSLLTHYWPLTIGRGGYALQRTQGNPYTLPRASLRVSVTWLPDPNGCPLRIGSSPARTLTRARGRIASHVVDGSQPLVASKPRHGPIHERMQDRRGAAWECSCSQPTPHPLRID